MCGDTALTYGELATRAVAVAGGLARLGVRRETLVGMSFARGVDAVVATVGIMLAGGAYVPVNPSFPAQRIRELLAASGVGLVVADTGSVAVLSAVAPDGVEVVDLARVLAWGSGTEVADFASPPPLDERSPLAHVLFTSGSTGSPKGVLVEHAGICRMAHEPEFLRFSPRDHVLHAHPLEFDATTLEVWSALLNGARLCVVDTAEVVVPTRFATVLRTHGITFAWVTAPLFNQLVDEDPAIFAPLTKVFTGGDVVSARHVNLVREHCPDLAVHNGYGPTENTVFTTLYRIDSEQDGSISIGRPIADTTVLVLDEDGSPVPPGAVGEIYTGGLGVARGYLDNPELTRERFVEIHGGRYYRTGDFAHQDADGLLYFHGRADGQVKVRGHRIETAEVTAALLAAPGVQDAHVRVVGTAVEDKRLVAYLVGPDTDEASVRAALAGTLPSYLRPDQLVWLDRLPLNANGKVDGAALPVVESDAVARHMPGEHRLAELWADVLGRDPDTIGSADAFLEIGGNSIKLGALLGRLDRRLGVRLPLVDAIQTRTLAGMSAALVGATVGHAPPIPPAAPGMPGPLHPRQLGLYVQWAAAPDSLVYNVPMRLRLRGAVEPHRLAQAFWGLVDRHDALRMRFVLDSGAVHQIAVADVESHLDYVAEPAADVIDGFVRPFRLDRPPLLRALLVRTGPDTHDLYLDAHHIALDGVSLRVLVDDLLALYLGIEPPEPPVTYAAAALWCHDRPADPAAEEFWLAELAEPVGADLRPDSPHGTQRATRGATVRRELPAGELDRLEQTARRAGTTPFTVALTAYVTAIARRTGHRDLVVGTPTSGRTAHPDLEQVVGMFVNMVGLRARPGDLNVGELLHQLDERRRGALSYPDYPVERLAKRLGMPHDPARNAIFDAVFAYQDVEFYEFDRGGLAISVELRNPGTTRYDLNLQVYRRPDRLVLELEYASELFHRATAERLLDECVRALAELADDPGTPVFSTPFSDPGEPRPTLQADVNSAGRTPVR